MVGSGELYHDYVVAHLGAGQQVVNHIGDGSLALGGRNRSGDHHHPAGHPDLQPEFLHPGVCNQGVTDPDDLVVRGDIADLLSHDPRVPG